jgi:maltose alpha-D-glucosyltransferase/alpha-amylase
MHSRWYRTDVIYSLDIGPFQDANGDEIGDIQGLISRPDCLARLRVTTIWLNPIHPSPRRGSTRSLARPGMYSRPARRG